MALSIYSMLLFSLGWLGFSFWFGSAMAPLPKMKFEFFIKVYLIIIIKFYNGMRFISRCCFNICFTLQFIISALSISIIFLPKLYLIIIKNDMQEVNENLVSLRKVIPKGIGAC